MPVILLVGSASRFIDQIQSFFAEKYEILILTDKFTAIRSFLANQDAKKLYLVPNLTKPERYEIFCLCRKNEQQLVSLCDENNDESVSSDKKILILKDFNGDLIDQALQVSKIAPTTANRRSKGTSLRSMCDLKTLIKEVNLKYLELGDVSFILQECEDRIVKMWKMMSANNIEDAEECYVKIVENELRIKGFLKK